MRKDITIPKGTEITAYTDGDIPLDPKKSVTQTAMSAEPSAAIRSASRRRARNAKWEGFGRRALDSGHQVHAQRGRDRSGREVYGEAHDHRCD